LLTTATLSVDNLSLSIDSEANLTIETGGNWHGTVQELADYLSQLSEDLQERIEDGEN
jgi:hypothetical protein